jgi:ribonuclease E
MSALSVFRRIKSMIVKGDVAEVKATVPSRVAEYLLNRMRAPLVELENQHGTRVTIQVRHALPDKDIAVEAIKEEATEQPLFEPIEEHLPLPMPEKAAASEEAAAAEEVKQPPKKAGRRRRRTKKRPEASREQETPSTVVPEYGLIEEELLSAETEEETPEKPAATLRGEDFFTGGTEDFSVLVEESAPEAVQAQARPRAGESPETEEIEAGRDEEPPAATEPAEEQAAAGSEPQPPETPEEPPKEDTEEKEPRKRRFSLQRFLPFS